MALFISTVAIIDAIIFDGFCMDKQDSNIKAYRIYLFGRNLRTTEGCGYSYFD